ncbi:DUF3501 family protein [Rehaibacterium terrae]|jgi:hypothetical protein|uniref:DUF3501 family protein n=1 Tax=Rehaibacterium terrae TaxID=1341696 RepID=A0A7W7Y1S0_9GAMM|nr:DUF3501 family protein [Rehaibacterium terrae]MBB5016522.1 hypothetical protein [Rehaibacterium terrae]
MEKLTRSDLYTLEAYAAGRAAFRNRVLAHKKARRLRLGEHVTLLFEDRLTIQYQIQEMLRIERIFEPEGIQDELDAYNPLIPDGSNLKATMLIEFPDIEQRRRELARLGGIEHRVYAQVDGHDRIFAIADEDLGRSEAGKTAAVHFLRFEFAPAQIMALRAGAGLAFGIDDDRLRLETRASEDTRRALTADFS